MRVDEYSRPLSVRRTRGTSMASYGSKAVAYAFETTGRANTMLDPVTTSPHGHCDGMIGVVARTRG
jgi:hypothetical protein